MRFASSVIPSLVVVVLCVWPAANSVNAQGAAEAQQIRSGRWIAFGLGVGNGQIDCNRCGLLEPNDPWNGGNGPSGYFAAGGTLSPTVLIGGELSVWARIKRSEGQQRDATLYLLALVAQYYPSRTSGLFIRGGAGVGGSTLAGGPGLVESGGWGLRAGAGYDLFVGESWALTPFVGYVGLFSQGAAGRNRGEAVEGPDDPSYLQAGLGIVWY